MYGKWKSAASILAGESYYKSLGLSPFMVNVSLFSWLNIQLLCAVMMLCSVVQCRGDVLLRWHCMLLGLNLSPSFIFHSHCECVVQYRSDVLLRSPVASTTCVRSPHCASPTPRVSTTALECASAWNHRQAPRARACQTPQARSEP